MEKKKNKQRELPITDGDARPDVPVDAEEVKNNEKRKAPVSGNKFETERISDINSLEDYKDAK
jgi:hypothetical protein